MTTHENTPPAHTPVPWTVEFDDTAWGRYTIAEAQRQLFDREDRCDDWEPLYAIDRANARLIEMACNSHADLIDSLEAIRNDCEAWLDDEMDISASDLLAAIKSAADVALANANGRAA